MNDAELVKVGHTRHDLRELDVFLLTAGNRGETESGLTNRKRFSSGLDFAYCITFPLGIHSVRMQKPRGSVDMEMPNKGKIFLWDRYFQLIIS